MQGAILVGGQCDTVNEIETVRIFLFNGMLCKATFTALGGNPNRVMTLH